MINKFFTWILGFLVGINAIGLSYFLIYDEKLYALLTGVTLIIAVIISIMDFNKDEDEGDDENQYY